MIYILLSLCIYNMLNITICTCVCHITMAYITLYYCTISYVIHYVFTTPIIMLSCTLDYTLYYIDTILFTTYYTRHMCVLYSTPYYYIIILHYTVTAYYYTYTISKCISHILLRHSILFPTYNTTSCVIWCIITLHYMHTRY